MSVATKRIARLLVGSAAAVVVVAAGFAVGSGAGAQSEWGCPPERIGLESFDSAGGPGSATQEQAVAWTADYLGQDGVAAASELREALSSRSGPNQFEPETGKVIVDGKVLVQMNVSQDKDGTWTMGSMSYCMPPPEDSKPGATPSPESK